MTKENTVGLDFQDIAAAVKDAAGWLGEIQVDNAGEIIQILIAERDDKLDPEDVNKILSSENTWDAFYDLVADIEDNSWDWLHSTKEEVLRSVMEEYPELDEDFLLDHLYVNYDAENLLNQEYPMFFNVNTGDGNYDYTLNPNYSMDEEEIKDLSNEASVVWLAGTQGYSREDIVGAILNGDYKGSKFLKSLRQEYIDTLSQMNSIIFLGTMSLKDMMNSKETGSIKVPANTVLGFWDGWSGSGSTIGIELEKPVVVPYEIRDRLYAAYGKTNDVYTPQEIFGLISKVYDADFILEVGLRENRKTRPIKDTITEGTDNVIEWKTYAELGEKLRQLGFADFRVLQIMEAIQDGEPVRNVGNLKFKRIKDSVEDIPVTKAQILAQLAKHFKDRFKVFIYGNNVEISSDTVASSMLFDEIYRKNIFGKLSNNYMSAPYDEDFVFLKLDKMKIGPVYLDESKKVEESTDSSFETIFWGIYDNEFDLPFNNTLEYIEKYYSSKIWGENEYANLENLSPEEKRDIIEFAKKEALNWDNMDLYNSHARYKSIEEINNQLYRFFGIENERIHD